MIYFKWRVHFLYKVESFLPHFLAVLKGKIGDWLHRGNLNKDYVMRIVYDVKESIADGFEAIRDWLLEKHALVMVSD